MKELMIALVLFLMSGCSALEAVSQPNADGVIPINEGVDAGLTALENGGIWAGLAALVFTTAKTAMRVKTKLKNGAA
jgi:uncharacterized protein YceK